ncbi:MAG: LytTR family DNA-binding domain-containing protein [Acidobacteriota bacterium]
MTSIRAVIVDDEALGRAHVRSLLTGADGWQVVGEAANGSEAAEVIAALSPDVVFLDIRMPGLSGLQVAETLATVKRPPLVVFATAFDGHALQAFEVEAADYLLKPFDRGRFRASLGRLERRLRRREASGGAETPEAPAPDAAGSGVQQLAVKSVGRVRLVDVGDIVWVAAAGNYVRLYLDERCLLHRSTLAGLERDLDPELFLRIHRSTLVQRRHVAEIRSSAAGRSQVVLHDGTELEISQRFRARALDALLP